MRVAVATGAATWQVNCFDPVLGGGPLCSQEFPSDAVPVSILMLSSQSTDNMPTCQAPAQYEVTKDFTLYESWCTLRTQLFTFEHL